ncbi:MAG: excisionase family DNA-binding protein [Bacteroidales bacterium]
MLGCSRPHIVKLLETGQIKFTKVGRHRRIKYEDIVVYKKRMKAEQDHLIRQIMDTDEKDGLYDRV